MPAKGGLHDEIAGQRPGAGDQQLVVIQARRLARGLRLPGGGEQEVSGEGRGSPARCSPTLA